MCGSEMKGKKRKEKEEARKGNKEEKGKFRDSVGTVET
jgi:hypothetical protein